MNQIENPAYKSGLEAIVQQNEAWFLQAQDGLFAMIEDDNDKQYIPVWSTLNDAEQYIADDWESYQAVNMSINELLNWCSELEDDNILIGAFPDKSFRVSPVVPSLFKKHVESMK